jgi:hypothetical protein
MGSTPKRGASNRYRSIGNPNWIKSTVPNQTAVGKGRPDSIPAPTAFPIYAITNAHPPNQIANGMPNPIATNKNDTMGMPLVRMVADNQDKAVYTAVATAMATN